MLKLMRPEVVFITSRSSEYFLIARPALVTVKIREIFMTLCTIWKLKITFALILGTNIPCFNLQLWQKRNIFRSYLVLKNFHLLAPNRNESTFVLHTKTYQLSESNRGAPYESITWKFTRCSYTIFNSGICHRWPFPRFTAFYVTKFHSFNDYLILFEILDILVFLVLLQFYLLLFI